MGWWKYDSAFAVKWREPQRFKWLLAKAELRRLRKPGAATFLVRMLAISFCLLTSVFLVAWLPAKLDPAREPPSLVLLPLTSAAASVFLMTLSLLAFLVDARFFPRTLVLARNWMGVIWEAWPRWLYPQVANVRFSTMRLNEEEFSVMVVTSREGRESILALSEKVDHLQITEFLRGKRVEVADEA